MAQVYINLLLAGVLVAVCAWTDIKSMTIYNRHTYPAAVAGIIYCAVTAQYAHLAGALIVFVMYLLLFILGKGKMGGGDLKLAVALSLFIGYEPVIYGSILAAVLMMAWGFARTWYKTGQLTSGVLVAAGKLPGGAMPFGAMMGPGSLIVAFVLYFSL